MDEKPALSPNSLFLKIKDIAIFALKCPNYFDKNMSAKSVLYIKHTRLAEIGTGKICVGQKKNREKTRNLKIEFEWGP